MSGTRAGSVRCCVADVDHASCDRECLGCSTASRGAGMAAAATG
jgi:hypothetical protein